MLGQHTDFHYRVCRCHTFGAPSAADGVFIREVDGIVSCVAKASNSRKFPIMVRQLHGYWYVTEQANVIDTSQNCKPHGCNKFRTAISV